ncbi:MAG: hypothetical protein B6D63_00365 [Candidatus Latescibacteria bacterium 4484_7]|nr:MAG: hypothetical protein B6D63_00365 [Candidatus Latescibacteria bacterium 4484_7]
MSEKKVRSSGVPQGIAGVICYFIPLVGGLLFLFVEKESKLVRFHAVQSILLWIFLVILGLIFGWISVLNIIVALVIVVVGIFMMYQALMERQFELPIIGKIARRQVYGGDDSGTDNESGTGSEGN